MKRLSCWAKDHVWSSRIIIVISFLILTVLAIVIGSLLDSLQVVIPVFFVVLSIIIYAYAFITYPSQKDKRNRTSFYIYQKTRDLMLAGSTFLILVFLGNHQELLFQYTVPFSRAAASTPSVPIEKAPATFKPINDFAASMRDNNGKALKWKERKKLLKEQVRQIKRSKDLSPGAKTLLIALSVMVAVALLYGVAALACSLSCSGSQVGAILVGVLGAGLVIYLLIITIRSIVKRNKKIKDKKPDG